MKWKSRYEYVDLDTGEVLTREEVKLWYDVVYKKVKSIRKNDIIIKHGIHHCKRKQQGDLFNPAR